MRSCDGCTACCVIYPVPEMGKPRHVPCQHLRNTGCAIHDQARPLMCTHYHCAWQTEPERFPENSRPDKSGMIFCFKLQVRRARFYAVVMSHATSHFLGRNRELLKRLKQQGHVVWCLFRSDADYEESYYWDERLYPALTEARAAEIFERNEKALSGDIYRQCDEFQRQQDQAKAR
jgi:hypothetical protein